MYSNAVKFIRVKLVQKIGNNRFLACAKFFDSLQQLYTTTTQPTNFVIFIAICTHESFRSIQKTTLLRIIHIV